MDKKQLFEEFFKPLVAIYGYPTRLKTDEEKKGFASEYLDDLISYKNVDWNEIKIHLKTKCSYFPKIPEIRSAIALFRPVTDTKQTYKAQMDAERLYRKRRSENRADIYRMNMHTIDDIISKGWGMYLAIAISDMFESADRHGKTHSLTDKQSRIHYSPSVCQGLDPIEYYSRMPVYPGGRKAMEKNPVQFVLGVWS